MSIYEGFLSIGGNEIVNNARTRGYAQSAEPCPMYWLKGDVCDAMNFALFEEVPYSYDAITFAPWYDPDVPQSADFFGFFATAITEVLDSTRTVSRTEGITDGGVLGRTRKATKTMRVKGLLMGRGRRAIEYGQTWLSAAIDPGACGQHGSECGLTDVQWFADCPPDRANIMAWTEWAETRRNLIQNPAFRTDANTWTALGGNSGSATITQATSGIPGAPVSTFARLRYVSGTWFRASTPVADVIPGKDYTFSGIFRSSPSASDFRLFIQWRNAAGSLIAEVPSPDIPLTFAGFRASFTATAPPDAVRATLQYGRAAGAVNDYVDATALMFEAAPAVRTYFDGSNTEIIGEAIEYRYAWLGPVNASQSIEETREYVSRAQTDAEYQATIDEDIRYLHDAAAISGPLITNTLESGEFFAYEVELVFGAERPWVYGVSKDVELPPTIPIVIQDIPYNLVPAPSAELASGDVITARNLSTNPSVETDATGWSTTADQTAILASQVVGARSTALASVGAASYRALFTAPSAGSNGWFSAQQTVVLTDPLERISVNLWAALIPLAGTSSPTQVDVTMFWRTAADATISTVELGTIPVAGGFISVSSLLPPANAAKVIVRAVARMGSWSSGATVQLFTDALAVTVP